MTVDRISVVEITKEDGARYAECAASEYTGEKVCNVRCLGGGSFGLAYSVQTAGATIVVKLFKSGNMLQKETHDLKLIAAHCPVQMPQVLFERKADDKIPVDCYGMTKLDGKPLMSHMRSFLAFKSKRKRIGEKVVDALHSVHTCTSDKFGDTLSPDCDTWTQCYRPFALSILQKAREYCERGQLSKKIIDVMNAAWEKFDVIFDEEPKQACLIHGDLNILNILISNDGEISFIDPLNSMYADREYDLFQFYNICGTRFYLGDIYRKKYGESRRCGVKLAFYGLWNEVFCFIKSGMLVPFIMNPLVKNMKKRLREL